MNIGVLTGGGDCPGLNAVIRAVVRKAEKNGDRVIGFRDAWKGFLANDYVQLTIDNVRGLLPRGGTILGTTRGSPYDYGDGIERTQKQFTNLNLGALIVIGGNGSLTVGSRLHAEAGLPIVGVPKTIDNDIVGTDVSFGFHTAVQVATDAIDRLHTTAESHDRVMVVEVMGRDAGWIALMAGIAGGATAILVPERPFDIARVCEHIERRHGRGRFASIVVVAEGARPIAGTQPELTYAKDQFGRDRLGGISAAIAPLIEERTGYDVRVVQIGHIQRGGTPTAYDRVLATRFGLAAVDVVTARDFGKMVVLRGDTVERVPMALTQGNTRTIDLTLYDEVESAFFG
ncbi:MAG: ATP-dependent 6-phosphofructokinase [Actinobacteria bacterium]|jgi:ATP-dependent phosphofructokinase / diphosphate-dependent phosphofructokinase|nr:ATP-dependent 6-phosphofructokinase [Actinomycetota bacterium]NBP53837.1 ATP-dependent 6-phosphofructokinase [Actinomycetota bacterium]